MERGIIAALRLLYLFPALGTRGAGQFFRPFAAREKWLRIHNSQERPGQYQPENTADLLKFYDYYCKGIDNGWEPPGGAAVGAGPRGRGHCGPGGGGLPPGPPAAAQALPAPSSGRGTGIAAKVTEHKKIELHFAAGDSKLYLLNVRKAAGYF